ncbi:hypothetical protein BOH66_10325 [Microbacterium aurum]|uniref:Recombinase XerD n=1 Tax=Microbacterium aurum TaxID=36805 RepID=A0A1P8U916_9MICO|nr:MULTISPECIES: hypothetical protein [Microbacterium]APZ34590.1 hypothetical protein BOH66_10325 [Microbacterium aurum]MBM7828476.1 hypothetical protein [Microbacterium aurum]ODT25013.1 MAG: hypothetical protein ABS64_04110 [Microbacterium sp. SCN 69-37]
MSAKIRVRWPDGAICGICFREAAHTYGVCAGCGDDRLLPGRDEHAKPICRDCAGITTNMTCGRCGVEAERFRNGQCARCVIEADLTELLKPTTPPDLRIKRLIQVFVESTRPESIYTWMRGEKAHELLRKIGDRELDLTPEAFNALPRGHSVEHLREILIHNRLMVAPADRHLAIFEGWVDARLRELQPHPDVASIIEQYARWHHLNRLRERVGVANMDIACRNARQQITEAGKFLIWVEQARERTVATFHQEDIDAYLDGAVTTRFQIKHFIGWFARGRGGSRKLYVPPRKAITLPTLTQAQRIQAIRNAVEFEQVALSTRVAALIHLLWATPLTRIVRLTADQLELRPDGMFIRLGVNVSEIPEPLAPMFWRQLEDRDGMTTNTGTDWLFPGYRAGRHLSVPTLQQRLNTLGIDPQRTRNTTLKQLTALIDVASLSDLLGYSPKTLAQHAERSGSHMARYVDAKQHAHRP